MGKVGRPRKRTAEAVVKDIIPDILVLFRQYEIHATWTTVGLLAYPNVQELLKENFPAIPYQNKAYSPFPITKDKYGDLDEELLLGKREIEDILKQKNQEIASHTFSHYYCVEEGHTTETFEEDCKRMETVGKTLDIDWKSIVFPRNQVAKDCLKVCAHYGYTAYRGNQENRFWKNSSYENESFFKKVGRVIDAYFKISKTKAYMINKLPVQLGVVNIPANRFLRPYSGKKWLEKRKVQVIKNEMFKAARKHQVYHLWWHPHNFSANPKESLEQLEEILAYALVLNKKFDFKFMNMGEIAAHVKN
ncbi:MAG: polysaccharide deacetylase family protein [Crocinitomicaceae bacterium]